jgi:pyridoxine 5'-phosphate synthase PdxJ
MPIQVKTKKGIKIVADENNPKDKVKGLKKKGIKLNKLTDTDKDDLLKALSTELNINIE